MVRLTERSVCSKKVVEYFWDVHFSRVTVEITVVDSSMDGSSSFSGTLPTVVVYCLKVGDVGSGVVVGNAVFVNCAGDMTL